MGEMITEESISLATGKTWTEWFTELESSPIKNDGIPSLITWLTEQHPDIGGWWCQVITRRWKAGEQLLSAAD
jgi:hypothetical protein